MAAKSSRAQKADAENGAKKKIRKRSGGGKCRIFRSLIGSKVLLLLIAALLLIAIGTFQLSANHDPHPGAWTQNDCTAEIVEYYHPCREDFRCDVCRITVKFPLPPTEAEPHGRVITSTLDSDATKEQCMSSFEVGEIITCYHRTDGTLDQIKASLEDQRTYVREEHFYSDASHLAQSLLLSGIALFVTYVLLGICMHNYASLAACCPCIRFFRVRTWIACCVSCFSAPKPAPAHAHGGPGAAAAGTYADGTYSPPLTAHGSVAATPALGALTVADAEAAAAAGAATGAGSGGLGEPLISPSAPSEDILADRFYGFSATAAPSTPRHGPSASLLRAQSVVSSQQQQQAADKTAEKAAALGRSVVATPGPLQTSYSSMYASYAHPHAHGLFHTQPGSAVQQQQQQQQSQAQQSAFGSFYLSTPGPAGTGAGAGDSSSGLGSRVGSHASLAGLAGPGSLVVNTHGHLQTSPYHDHGAHLAGPGSVQAPALPRALSSARALPSAAAAAAATAPVAAPVPTGSYLVLKGGEVLELSSGDDSSDDNGSRRSDAGTAAVGAGAGAGGSRRGSVSGASTPRAMPLPLQRGMSPVLLPSVAGPRGPYARVGSPAPHVLAPGHMALPLPHPYAQPHYPHAHPMAGPGSYAAPGSFAAAPGSHAGPVSVQAHAAQAAHAQAVAAASHAYAHAHAQAIAHSHAQAQAHAQAHSARQTPALTGSAAATPASMRPLPTPQHGPVALSGSDGAPGTPVVYAMPQAYYRQGTPTLPQAQAPAAAPGSPAVAYPMGSGLATQLQRSAPRQPGSWNGKPA